MTGREVWKFFTAPGKGEPGEASWGGLPVEKRIASSWGLPGSYDPVTHGHLDVIERAASIFDRVVVGVVGTPRHKETMFTLDERVGFLREALAAAEDEGDRIRIEHAVADEAQAAGQLVVLVDLAVGELDLGHGDRPVAVAAGGDGRERVGDLERGDADLQAAQGDHAHQAHVTNVGGDGGARAGTALAPRPRPRDMMRFQSCVSANCHCGVSCSPGRQ